MVHFPFNLDRVCILDIPRDSHNDRDYCFIFEVGILSEETYHRNG